MQLDDNMRSSRAVRFYVAWLRLALGLVMLMVLIGGLTRLTESGLSIVEWKLVSGTLPPMSAQGWADEFADYQATPEFIKKNHYMELADFKRIYWLEYLHRLLGRIIGLAFMVPLLYALIRRDMPRALVRRSWGLLALVCVQGTVGWYMVKSGLVHQPWVSPYRLAFHLLLATAILGWLYWIYMQLTRARTQPSRQGAVILAMILLQIAYGAFVAGLHAGHIYNSFPMMGDGWLPGQMWPLSPAVRNLFETVPTVQFIHRWFAFVVFAAICWQWMKRYEMRAAYVLLVALVQVMLGVATLLSVVQIGLASVHQMVAMVLVVMQLRYMYGSGCDEPVKNNEKIVGQGVCV